MCLLLQKRHIIFVFHFIYFTWRLVSIRVLVCSTSFSPHSIELYWCFCFAIDYLLSKKWWNINEYQIYLFFCVFIATCTPFRIEICDKSHVRIENETTTESRYLTKYKPHFCSFQFHINDAFNIQVNFVR